MTLLSRKTAVRANMKTAMIKEFLLKLDTLIEQRESTQALPQTSLRPAVNARDLECLSPQCEFVEYLELYYPQMPFWRLPVSDDRRMLCKVCEGITNGSLTRSGVGIRRDHDVILTHKHI